MRDGDRGTGHAAAGQEGDRLRSARVTDKPITHLVLTHYHAVRVLGASAFAAPQIVMSREGARMVAERGNEDWDSEFARFPRLFEGHDEIPGLTWPTTTFTDRMSVYLGQRRIDLMHLGRAHTAGDIVAYVPDANAMFTGDIVEYRLRLLLRRRALPRLASHARPHRGLRGSTPSRPAAATR